MDPGAIHVGEPVAEAGRCLVLRNTLLLLAASLVEPILAIDGIVLPRS
jgi:hypothetical protein